jgi:putative chitinase
MSWFSPLAAKLRSLASIANVTKPIPPAGKPVLPPQIKAANAVLNEAVFDKAAFFASVRKSLFAGKLVQKQVSGTEAILDAVEALPLSWAAYALATAFHETARTMEPVKEFGGKAYFMERYDKTGKKPKLAKALGNTEVGDGALFAGRGYVQLTGRRNYVHAGGKLGVDLVGNTDLAMRPDIAARILREGMKEGWFTGKGFASYLPASGKATRAQYGQARRIINGVDRADKIAGEALAFEAALIAGGWA